MTAPPALVAGRYRLVEKLGEGGMGRVWRARDETLERDVAVKEVDLPAELLGTDRDEARWRTLREARSAARLSHPNAVQVYDVFEADGRPWIVMEYVPSRSLQQVLREEGPLDPRRAARIGLQVLAALSAAHRAGVQHRDVKPANVLLGEGDRAVLTDFGIATIENDGLVTGSGVVIGSPEYMPPERVRHGRTEPASDLWSLGATLYAAVEGQSPYRRPSAIETLTALAADEPEPPQRAGVLQSALEGLLQVNPDARTDLAETERRLRVAASARRFRRPSIGRRQVTGAVVPAPRERPAAEMDNERPAAEVDASPPVEVTPHPDADPAAGPPRRARLDRRVLLAGVAVLAAAGTLGIWAAVRPDQSSQPPRPTPTVAAGPPASANPTPARSPSPTASTSPPARAITTAGRTMPPRPAGWVTYRDPTGFSLYVPRGWTRSKERTIVYFRDPRRGRVLGIDQTDKPIADPVADWKGKAAYRVAAGDFPGYHQVRIVPVRYWQKAADWEFTFDGRVVRQHVNNRGVITSKTQAYGIYWQTSDADWATARPDLQLIFDSFRPDDS
jgi:hypothetical protein